MQSLSFRQDPPARPPWRNRHTPSPVLTSAPATETLRLDEPFVMFHPASPSSVVAFLLTCLLVLAAFLRGVWISARSQAANPLARTLQVAGGVALWIALISRLVASGWVEEAPVHTLAFGSGIMLGSLLLGLSRVGKWLAGACALPWLLAFQGFRLPLELVLHSWVRQGVIPGTMTWTGSNPDILSGIAALLLAPFCRRSIGAGWAGNILGLALLLNVGRVAILSSPVPFAWQGVSPRLQLAFHLPYALIVPICVGGALAGHVILTRALIAAKR